MHIVHDHLSPETKAKVDNAFSVIQQVTAEADKDLKIAQSIAPLPAVVTAEAVIGIALNAEKPKCHWTKLERDYRRYRSNANR